MPVDTMEITFSDTNFDNAAPPPAYTTVQPSHWAYPESFKHGLWLPSTSVTSWISDIHRVTTDPPYSG